MVKRVGRIGQKDEYVEYSNGRTAKFIAQKSRDCWMLYFMNRKTLITLDTSKSKSMAEKLAKLAAKVYFDICT